MSFIDLTLADDQDDCLILSPHSGNACKLKGQQSKEMHPQKTNSRREAGIKEKENQVTLFPAAAAAASASHNKRMRSAEKMEKKNNQVTLILADTAAEKKNKSEIAGKKKKKPPISVNKKIPGGVLHVISPTGSRDFNMHKSLAGKKVILYGLPGYQNPVVHYTPTVLMELSTHWRPFYQNRVIKPYMEFIEKADYLIANGVDEIVFFCVNINVLLGAEKNRYIMERYNYLKFISDYRDRYLNGLGLEMDIPQEGMPHRSRRFILLVDDLKVKYANIESSDEKFIIPSAEEIIKAFDQRIKVFNSMSFIDLTLADDQDDCLILSSQSGLGNACKLKGKQSKEMHPQKTNSRREAGIKEKENQVTLFPAAAAAASASHNKRIRRAEKMEKKNNQVTLILADTAAEKKNKSEIAGKKKKKPPISVNKKIPGGVLRVISPTGTREFNMHKSLAGKKVILYGLPGYQNPVVHYTPTVLMEFSTHWRPFYQNRVIKPYMEFIEKADYLIANGVDEIVFFCVNLNVLLGAEKNRDIMDRYNYLKFISDYRDRYLNGLGLEMDIPQEGMPHRSRRFILLVDDLKVKYANIESSDEKFIIPSAEEIIKAFDQ